MHAFSTSPEASDALEKRINGMLAATIDETDNKLSLYLPVNTLLEASGRGPSGCGSTFDEETSSSRRRTFDEEGSGEPSDAALMHHLLDVSLSFTCAATGAAVAATFSREGVNENQLAISLTPEQARLFPHPP